MWVLFGCTTEPAVPPRADSTPAPQRVFVNREAGLRLTLPAGWLRDRYTIQVKTGSEAAAVQPDAAFRFAFDYRPLDPAATAHGLLTVLVLNRTDRADRAGTIGQPGPPIGELLAETDARVYVAVLPRGNPYPPESEDGRLYAAMALTPARVRSAFSLLGQAEGGTVRHGLVTGTVNDRGGITLTPDAALIVQLLSVAGPDAPAALIGEKRYVPIRQFPVSFEIRYDPDLIDPAKRYEVSAQIQRGDRTLFANDRAYPVLTQGNPSRLDILLRRAE